VRYVVKNIQWSF